MSRSGGRTLDLVWQEVTKSEDGKTAWCIYCSASISCKVERIRAHMDKCSKKYKFFREKLTNDESLAIDTNLLEDRTNMALEVCKKRKVSMSSYVVTTTASQKEDLDKKVAKCFYANNIPFNSVENACTKDMFQALRPGYQGPTRKEIAGHLLDKVHDDMESTFRQEVKNKSATLMMDGWSSIKNDPILASSVQVEGKTQLLSAEDALSSKKTAEFCVEIAKKNIEDLRQNYEVEVFAFVSDNENKMKKMKNLLEDIYPDLLTYGCSAHWLNLVEKAVTPKSGLKYIIEIHKYFRNNHQAHGWLKEKNGLMPQLPNDTR